MNSTVPYDLSTIILCPLCGVRKPLDAFLDPYTCTIVTHCSACRSQSTRSMILLEAIME